MTIKEKIVSELNSILDKKISVAEKAIALAKESRDNDTKSSAGDKYETGRAMMQLEIDKNQTQLSKNQNLKNELSKINFTKKNQTVQFGSIVNTTNGNYFISIGIGKLAINDKTLYCISLASPIGQLLENKTSNEKVSFQGRELRILKIE